MQKNYVPEKLPLLRRVTSHPSIVRNAEGLQGECPPFCFVLSHNNNLGLQIWSTTSLSPVQKKQSHPRNVYNCV